MYKRNGELFTTEALDPFHLSKQQKFLSSLCDYSLREQQRCLHQSQVFPDDLEISPVGLLK